MALTLDLISDITTKSKQLLSLAEDADWEDFSSIDAERQELLSGLKLRDSGLSEQENNHLYEQMDELININEQLEALCVARRDTVANEMTQLRKGSEVTQAYLA